MFGVSWSRGVELVASAVLFVVKGLGAGKLRRALGVFVPWPSARPGRINKVSRAVFIKKRHSGCCGWRPALRQGLSGDAEGPGRRWNHRLDR